MGILLACAVWKAPEAALANGLKAQFELVYTFGEDSHWRRLLLKCRGCGQLYIYDFYEVVDWETGEDPQFATWVPINTEVEIKIINSAPPGGMQRFIPRLCMDWPKTQPKPSLFWVKRFG